MVGNRERMRDVFDRARHLPRTQRAAFLDGLGAGDAPMRAQIEDMLAALDEAGPFMADPTLSVAGDGPGGEEPRPADAAPTSAAPLREGPGTRIGPYKLLQLIGEGGFGSVFMAEQEKPVVRRVALKIIKLGMDTRQVIARFEAERQALAMMDHPNIARVLDAGATDTGRPYFVMELVRGEPITEYCDKNHLSTRERLDLFIDVCHAVQHAHQKGIIHRDIKPSNVLITMHDGVPVPKVIDFGIAKATQGRLTEKTLFTEHRQMIGTPEYMSPEQAEMSGLDVDTRSDIYSLGVLLYELLTGSTPFSGQNLRSAAFGEIQRIIREVEPQKPSTRISTLGQTLAGVAAHRHIEPRKLGALIRGDLDWIVMKALEKDRVRRYDTANGFAADVKRYLDDEAVEASPPSATYKLRKLARRYRAPLRAAGVFALLLVAATLFSSWEAIRATRARAAAEIEKQRAGEKAATATHITESLQQMLGAANPDTTKGPDYTVRQLLDEYAAHLGDKLAGEPEAEATLHSTIGMAYWRLADFEKAEKHTARALELRRRVFGPRHDRYADSLVDYAWVSKGGGIGEVEAEPRLREALAIYRERGVEGARVIHALEGLQLILNALGKNDQVEELVAEALAEAQKAPDTEFPDIANMYHGLVQARLDRSDYAGAERAARQSVAMHLHLQAQGPDHPETAWGYTTLADALTVGHKFTDAMVARRQALAIMRKILPPDHQYIALALDGYVTTLCTATDSSALTELFPSPDDLAALESMFREMLATQPPQPNGAAAQPAFAAARGLGRFGEFYAELARELDRANKTVDAQRCRQSAATLLQGLQAQLASNPDLLAGLYSGGVHSLMSTGQRPQAIELCRRLLALTPKTGAALNDVAWFLATAAEQTNRDPTLAVALAERAATLSPRSRAIWNTLGTARYRVGDCKQAVVDLQRSVQLSGGGNGCDFYFLAMAHQCLGATETARGFYAQAIQWTAQHDTWQGRDELHRFHDEALALLGAEADALSVKQPATPRAPR